MKLSEVKKGSILKTLNINIQDINLRKYLKGLGLDNNTFITKLYDSIMNGPIIIYLRNYQLAIDRKIAKNIEVDYV